MDTEKTIAVKAYNKAELAHMYNPDMTYASSMRTLRSWIAHNKTLSRELKKTGYVPSQHKFIPKQVELIFTYLGMP
ncbi:DUF4248 domain-containing protein [Phocaeicola sp.]